MKSWSFNQLNQWVNQASLQALEDAYQGALVIQNIEAQHFNGGAIRVQSDQGKTVTDYFRTQLDRQLLRIRSSLVRFRVTSFLVDRPIIPGSARSSDGSQPDVNVRLAALASEVTMIEKLALIESVIGKYRVFDDAPGELLADKDPKTMPVTRPAGFASDNQPASAQALSEESKAASQITDVMSQGQPPKPVSAKGGAIAPKPASVMNFWGGAAKIRQEFSTLYEQEVVQELRVRRAQNRVAVRWLAFLLVIPLVMQVLTKHLVLDPILGGYSTRNPTKIELSNKIAAELIHEFSEYKEALEIKHLLVKAAIKEEQKEHKPLKNPAKEEEALAAVLSAEVPDDLVKDLNSQPGELRSFTLTSGWTEVKEELYEKALEEKAVDLWREAREEQLNGIKNVIADGVALLGFGGLVYFGRHRLTAVRNFSNRTFLSLNDPTKVFMFILISDMFVGFHSAEGWEVILEGIAHHFGLPESRVLINGFIATVPVFIDSCIKFWIFTYLTRYSPSASAIYERMNT